MALRIGSSSIVRNSTKASPCRVPFRLSHPSNQPECRTCSRLLITRVPYHVPTGGFIHHRHPYHSITKPIAPTISEHLARHRHEWHRHASGFPISFPLRSQDHSARHNPSQSWHSLQPHHDHNESTRSVATGSFFKPLPLPYPPLRKCEVAVVVKRMKIGSATSIRRKDRRSLRLTLTLAEESSASLFRLDERDGSCGLLVAAAGAVGAAAGAVGAPAGAATSSCSTAPDLRVLLLSSFRRLSPRSRPLSLSLSCSRSLSRSRCGCCSSSRSERSRLLLRSRLSGSPE
jgi:hypothetical protein